MGTETMRLSMMKLISSIDKRKVPDGDGNNKYRCLQGTLEAIDKRKVPDGD